MAFFSALFSKMRMRIQQKVENEQPGLYTALLLPITFSFLLTFGVSRLIGYTIPEVFLELPSGLHVHHFTYGIFVLIAAGYLALVHNGPRAKFYIALLFGIGIGLAFDEFGMWLRLDETDPVRWEYDGFNIILALVILIATIKPGLHFLFTHWPLRIFNHQNTKKQNK